MENIWYIVNVEAAIYKEDRWLIIKRGEKEEHAPGLLSMVGGKVEINSIMDNVLEETLKREIMEEVGIEIFDKIYYVESKAFLTDKGQMVIDIVFFCKYKSGEASCVSTDEVREIYWMSYEEIISNPNSPKWLVESIKKAEKIKRESYFRTDK